MEDDLFVQILCVGDDTPYCHAIAIRRPITWKSGEQLSRGQRWGHQKIRVAKEGIQRWKVDSTEGYYRYGRVPAVEWAKCDCQWHNLLLRRAVEHRPHPDGKYLEQRLSNH